MMSVILAIAIVAAVLFYEFPIITVCGNSMYPTYLDGEVILSTRAFSRRRLKRGDVVIYKSPDGKPVIKRLDDIDLNACVMYCVGDNLIDSHDSRDYGYVATGKLICKPFSQRKKEV